MSSGNQSSAKILTLRLEETQRRYQETLEELRASEEQAREALRLLDNIIENIPTAVQVKSVVDGLRIQRWNKAAEILYGVPASEAIGRTVFDLWPRDKAEKMHEADLELIARGGGMDDFRDREAVTRHQGEIRVHMRKVPLVDSGRVTHLIVIADDVTERRQTEERIRYLATHDSLTGLPNRAMFGEMLAHAVEAGGRYRRAFAVMFVDLDRFKEVNDTFGHEAGDLLLKAVAGRLAAAVRASDIVARLSGDEFVILIEEAGSREQVVPVARKVLAAAVEPVDLGDGRRCGVSASVGIALFPEDGADSDALLRNADAAMYRAKQAGKNGFRFHADPA